MRKISKAAAALTAGCMLLSTSAFAAIEDNINGKALLVNGEYTVNLDYTTAGQSTIIVLTEGTKLADANEDNILYINQAAIADGKATYAINLGTSFAGNAVVYAGGTAETATELGTLTTIKDVEDLTLTADVNELEFGQTATLTATVIPDDATNKTVEWTGNVTDVVTVGNVTTAKFVAPEVSEDTDFVITAKVGDFTETVTIKVKAKVVVPEEPKLPETANIAVRNSNPYGMTGYSVVKVAGIDAGSVAIKDADDNVVTTYLSNDAKGTRQYLAIVKGSEFTVEDIIYDETVADENLEKTTIGDIAGNDFKSTVTDVSAAIRYALGSAELNTDLLKLASDVNGDGGFSVTDVSVMIRYALGSIEVYDAAK